jgi:SAM-dependent methyltransferase
MTAEYFKDYFSDNSAGYRKYRPAYPDSFFEYLAIIAPSSAAAWDCATGSGQAARKLARHFSKVIATDASIRQISNAVPDENVYYQVARAENSPIHSSAVDLITIAQALHWLDAKPFFAEAKRVLKPKGILAVWSYNLLSVTPQLDDIIERFYKQTVGPYWPPERRLVEEGYQNISFPFTRIVSPDFSMTAEWSLEELLGYIATWSAVKVYRDETGNNPLDALKKELGAHWGEPCRRYQVSWPLSVFIGKNDG